MSLPCHEEIIPNHENFLREIQISKDHCRNSYRSHYCGGCGFFAVHALLLHLNRYYDQIAMGMSLSQVRQSLAGNFRESAASVSAIEKDGYPLKHLISDGENIHARKYALRIWAHLYFYVIYDSSDKVRLTIAAYE